MQSFFDAFDQSFDLFTFHIPIPSSVAGALDDRGRSGGVAILPSVSPARARFAGRCGMSALRITAATIARTMLSALPEGLRLQVACNALLSINDGDMAHQMRTVAQVASDHAAVLQTRADVPNFTRFSPIQGGLK
jgi:hypothetical protein